MTPTGGKFLVGHVVTSERVEKGSDLLVPKFAVILKTGILFERRLAFV